MSDFKFSGARDFTHITPSGRRLSEYEAVVCNLQPGPNSPFDAPGYYAAFRDGRPLWSEDSTALRSSDWFAYRDPAQLWQRPYVALQEGQERAISTGTHAAISAGLVSDIDRGWLDAAIAKLYHGYAFCEKGLSRALSFAQREALSDTVAHVLIFESFDKVRHVQDIVLHGEAIEGVVPGFDAQQGRHAWMDGSLRPLRLLTEEIMALQDWAEIVVAVNLFLDQLVGEAMVKVLLLEGSRRHRDPITPIVAMTVLRDRIWALDGTRALVRMLCEDESHGQHNREVLAGWSERWSGPCLHVLDDLLPAIGSAAGMKAAELNVAREQIVARWQVELVTTLGVAAEPVSAAAAP